MMLTLPGVSPPARIGASQTEMPAVALSIVIAGTAGTALDSSAIDGIWPSPHQQPTQIGLSGSPRSNSTQTLAPMRGRMNVPISESVSGTHGIAQLVITIPGTLTSRRPLGGMSWLSMTVPRYLPQWRLATGGSGSCSEPHVNCSR